MARPKMDGLKYFPLDVTAGMDDEIELLEAEYGLEGFAVFVKLLQKIYKNNYYMEWTEKEKLQFSKRVNTENNRVDEIISACFHWGLLSETLFNQFRILTSRGIQKRFLLAIGRRTAYKFYKEYLLLSKDEVSEYKNLVIVAITPVNVTLTPHNVNINPQSKVKEIESKEKEKEIESSSKEENPAATIQLRLESCFGRLISPYELSELCSYLDNEITLELVERAITESADSGVRELKYIKTILNRCLEQKIFTIERYELDQKEFKNKKASASKDELVVKKNKFTNMMENGYDYAEIERLEDEFIDRKLRGET